MRRAACSQPVRAPPTAGSSLELTIDEYLQHIAERELRGRRRREPGRRRHARSSWIRGPARSSRWPTSRPSTRTSTAIDRDGAAQPRVQDLYEPGSTFKVVTASAAHRREGDAARRPSIDDGPRPDPDRPPRHRRVPRPQLRRALVRRTSSSSRATSAPIKIGFRVGTDRLSRLRRALRVRPPRVARFPRREPRHRLGAPTVDRERAGLGVDGLSGRRDAAADGGRRERGRQRRRATSSRASCAPSYRGDRRLDGQAEGAAPRHQREHRGDDDDHHGTRRRATARRRRRRFPATRSPARPARPTSSSTAATRRPRTTCRLSASCRRASRRSRSSW